MEYKCNYEYICQKSVLTEGSSEQPVSSEITLPDYFPDIVRVVRSRMRVNISSQSVLSGKLTVEGSAVLSVLYLCGEGMLHCFEQRLPFSKTVDVKDDEGCIYVTQAKTEFVNCRVVSQRKLDIHASISIYYKGIIIRKETVFCGCEDVELEKDSALINTSSLTDFKSKYFNITETVETGSTQPSVSQIASSCINARLLSTKLISDKILIKGELNVNIVYISENDGSVEHVSSTVPFSQIIEASSNEQSTAFVGLSVSGYDIFAKTDSSSQLRLFELSANVRADISIYDNREISVVNDLYSTEYNVVPTVANVELRDYIQTQTDTYLVRDRIEINNQKITAVYDASAAVSELNYKCENGIFKFFGTVSVNLLNDTENEGVTALEKTVEFEFEKDVDTGSKSVFAELCGTVTGVSFNIIGDNSVEVRAEIEIASVLFSENGKKLISNIEINEDKKDNNKHGVTVYFADKGERVWDIAKRFNTTVNSLCEENSLSTQKLEADKKLIIIS